MKSTTILATASTANGDQLVLRRRDTDYSISANGYELMTSREHESELCLARLACERLREHRNPAVMIGGLGMGYTLRQALDLLPPGATVIVSELLPEVVEWNRTFLRDLTGNPLADPRVKVVVQDAAELMRESERRFDAIMLDIDNGPDALVTKSNHQMYNREGIATCIRSLHRKGVLAIWADRREATFERRVKKMHLHLHFFKVPAYKGARALSRCIYTISNERRSLPTFEAPAKPKHKGDANSHGVEAKDKPSEET